MQLPQYSVSCPKNCRNTESIIQTCQSLESFQCNRFLIFRVVLEVSEQWTPVTRGWYHGGRRPSSDDSFHSPPVILPSALDKPRIMKHYHRWWVTRWGVTAPALTMVTLHDTWFVECQRRNDNWTVKTVVTWQPSASMIPASGSHQLTLPQVMHEKKKQGHWTNK